jgi:tetratricopeptide (TPR) repeat protein
LAEQARTTGEVELLDQAAAEFGQILAAISPTDVNYEVATVNLASALISQYEWTGKAEALEHAVRILQDALAHPVSSREREAILRGTLGWALLRDAERSGSVATIKKAVAARRRALKITGNLDPLNLERLSEYGAVLAQQFSMTGDQRAITEAVDVHQVAVSATPPGDAQLANRLGNLASALDRVATHSGDADDLQDAVDAYREAMAASRPGDPERPMFLSNLGIGLMHVFEQTGSRPALDEAVERQREALEATPGTHVELGPRRTNLAAVLLSLYERTAQLAVLDEAVNLYAQSVDQTSADHGNRARYLYGLGSALLRRAQRTGDLDSLDDATSLLADVVTLTPDGHPNKPNRLSALAAARFLLFQEVPERVDQAESAISLTRAALDLTAKDDGQRPRLLSNLGGMLDGRFERTRDQKVLQESIAYHREALAAAPAGHSERANYLSNYGIALTHQAQLSDDNSVLDEAVRASLQALDGLPVGYSERARTLLALGTAYQLRFERTQAAGALADGLAAFGEAAEDGTASAQIRVSAGRDGGRLAASAGSVQQALDMFATAVELVDQAAWSGLRRTDQERLLSQLSGLPMDAAAMAIEAGFPERAVELLEQGRGVLLARQMEAPGKYAALRQRVPELADALAEVQRALDAPELAVEHRQEQPDRLAPLRAGADQRVELGRRRDALLEQVAGRADLQSIVAPPPFSRLLAAAVEGPVVVLNVSSYRCDALIVADGRVRVTPLPDLSAESVDEHTANLMKASDEGASQDVNAELRWLWDSAVGPILTSLGLTSRPTPGEPFSRLWWCSTGSAAFLPLHAAGHYDEDGAQSFSALNLVASSYTPTMRVLLQLRERRPRLTTDGEGLLIVAMPQTPNAAPLDGAAREAEVLKDRFAASTLLSGPEATLAAVTATMRNHHWVHFSCHGVQNPSAPSRARLLLYDEPLMIQQITGMNLADASLAYLSACDTYRGGSAVPDEGITLAAALQLAGYQHVIATLWQIGVITSDVTRHFYSELAKNAGGTARINADEAARALRAAISSLREESPGIPPMLWASYIHTGP